MHTSNQLLPIEDVASLNLFDFRKEISLRTSLFVGSFMRSFFERNLPSLGFRPQEVANTVRLNEECEEGYMELMTEDSSAPLRMIPLAVEPDICAHRLQHLEGAEFYALGGLVLTRLGNMLYTGIDMPRNVTT